MNNVTLHEGEFSKIRSMMHRIAGISISPAKKEMVSGRLARRLRERRLGSFAEYLRLLDDKNDPSELRIAVDLLTTNETYFFREPKHFEFIQRDILPKVRPGETFRVWSAASSSGEEAYSMAMLLDDALGGQPWEIFGSDISTRVLESARRGQYKLDRIDNFPPGYLKRYCLRGIDEHEGTLLIDRRLRQRVQFKQVNLNEPLPAMEKFDLILLRNVMIYFDPPTKQGVVSQLVHYLKPGGHLLIGHSESLHGISSGLQMMKPSIYRKPHQAGAAPL